MENPFVDIQSNISRNLNAIKSPRRLGASMSDKIEALSIYQKSLLESQLCPRYCQLAKNRIIDFISDER